MNATLLRPDDRTPEERLRDAIDEAEAEAYAEMAEDWRCRIRRAITPMRLSLLVITALWAFTMWNVSDSYSPRVAWLCTLCTAWGLAGGFLLTYEWLSANGVNR